MAFRDNRRVLWTVLFILWLCVVWGHSMLPADLSSEESSWVVALVRPFFSLFGVTDGHVMTHVIRKGAHFTEYVILMLIGVKFVREWAQSKLGTWLSTVAIWVCVPMVDETIQRFTPGRAPRITDVCIDMAGGLLGMLISHAILKRAKPR